MLLLGYHDNNDNEQEGLNNIWLIGYHCMKSVRIWSFSDPYFPAFELNTERYGVFSAYSAWAREFPNMDTFHSVYLIIESSKAAREPPWPWYYVIDI